eukprot:gene51319-68687_t
MLASWDQKTCCICCIWSMPCMEAGSQVLKIVSGFMAPRLLRRRSSISPMIRSCMGLMSGSPMKARASSGVQVTSTFTFMGHSVLPSLACYDRVMTTPWLAKNPRALRPLEFGREQQFVINPNGIPELCEELKACPAHKPTPLYELPALAARLGVGEIRVKDESQRFGFGAFKALGGVIAVANVLTGAVGDAYHSSPSFESVMKGEHKEITGKFVFTAASSGNHGRS